MLMKKVWLIILATVLVTSFFAACSGGSSSPIKKEWTVTFDKNGGDTEAEPTTKTIKSPATTIDALPTAPTRAGYTFTGWNTEADGTGDEFTATTHVTDDIIVYAQWRQQTVVGELIVTFNRNGGDTEANPDQLEVVPPDTTIDALPTAPTRTGYTFAGWNTAADGTGTAFTATTPVTADITVYAQWTPITYYVTCDKNGGDTEADPQSIPITFPNTSIGDTQFTRPTRAGYIFKEWNTSADGTGTVWTRETPVTANVTVYAIWDQIQAGSFIVTFDKNGGTNDPLPAAIQVTPPATTVGTLPTPSTRDGHVFTGWNTAADGTGDAFTASTTVTATITVYAQWQAGYIVTFNVNGGSGTNTTKTVLPPATTVDALPTAPTRSGYVFNGWNTASNGSGTAFTATTTVNGTITVYAQWAAIHTVTFNKNGGDTEADPQTKTVTPPATTIDALPTAPTRANHTFIEWNTASNGSGTAFTAATTVTSSITVYAKWEIIPGAAPTVTFDKNNGDTEANPASITVTPPATTIDTLPTAPTRAGYTFAGWFTSQTGGTQFTATTPVTADITVYAHWTVLPTYTVTFNLNHADAAGASATPPVQNIQAGSTVTTLPAAPTRSQGWGVGTTFAGWYLNTAGTGTAFDTSTVVSASITVYAKWGFTSGTPEVVGNTLVVNAPLTEKSTNNGHGSFSGTENADGSVTYSSGAVRYAFPNSISDYDYFTIEYVQTGGLHVILKQYNTTNDYMPRTGNQWPTLTDSGSFEFEIGGAGGTGGIAMQINDSTSGTIKFTKVTFTKGVRHTITFNVNGGNETYTPIEALVGAALSGLPTPTKDDGSIFTGWNTASDGSGTAYTKASLMPDSDLLLYAQWEAPAGPLPDIVVDFTSMTFTPTGTASVTAQDSTSYTYSVTSYNNFVRFTVDIGSAKLGQYDKISFTILGVSGDTNYKNCNVAGGTVGSLTDYTNPNSNAPGSYYVTTFTGSSQNIQNASSPINLSFDIDKTKAATANLTGTIEFAVIVNCDTAFYKISNFKIIQNPPPSSVTIVWEPAITASTPVNGGEYIGNTGIQATDKANVTLTPIANGFTIAVTSGYKAFNIQTPNAGGTDYYTSEGFTACAAGETYTLSFMASVDTGTGHIRFASNGGGLGNDVSINTTPTLVSYSWTQTSGNLQFDTGDTPATSVITITGIKVTTP